MNLQTAARLIEINRQFYQTFAVQFSQTRGRIQPGVRRLLNQVDEHARVLDLGCGNGELAAALSENGFQGEYTGIDMSPGLLEAAYDRMPGGMQVRFLRGDLTNEGWDQDLLEAGSDWTFLFAVLHHIPGEELRVDLFKKTRRLLAPGGRLALSAWQFKESSRLRDRIQPWERVGIREDEVDQGDYLLDWRSGGEGLRYVHQFDEIELRLLAEQAGYSVIDSYRSDGAGGNLSLYNILIVKH